MDLSLEDRRIHYRAKRCYKVLRGRVENLTARQDYWLISWARCELSLTRVLMHGFFHLPPRLQEGDEVVVAGFWKNPGFRALACAKVGESEEELRDRLRAQKRRRLFWTGVAAAIVAVVLLGVVLSGAGGRQLWQVLASCTLAALSISSIHAAYSRAEIELELALAEGGTDSATGEP